MAQMKNSLVLNKNSVKSTSNPLISIVTVVFNSQGFLAATIQSVIEQSYQNVEYIIIDGGSTDGTIETIEQYESYLSCWISESDRGIYDAMNKGIARARGEIIGILNSGDRYTQNALQQVAQLYQENCSVEQLIITGAMIRFDPKTKIEFVQRRQQTDLVQKINWGMPINHPATFVTKSVYQTIGYFDSEFKIGGDYDFIYRAYHNRAVKFVFTDSILAVMSMGGISEKLSGVMIRAREAMQVRQHRISKLLNTMLALRLITIGYIKYLLIAVAGQKAVLLRHGIEQKTINLKNLVDKP